MKRILQVAIYAALALLFVGISASSAVADEPPWPAGIPWPTTMPWPTASPLKLGVPWSPSQQTYPVYAPAPAPVQPYFVPAPTPLPPVVQPSSYSAPLPPVILPSNNPAPVSAPPAASYSSGSAPYDALEPTNSWRTLGAGSSVWYKIGTDGVHMDVWLESSPHSGVAMAVYAPNNFDRPVGRGTPDKADPTRLLWSGGHWSGEGNWYALITNSNPMSIQYKIGRTQMDISNKSCYSYWEYIGTNLVYWTKCE